MEKLTKLILILFFMPIVTNLNAQSDEQNNKASVELIAQLYAGSVPISQNSPTSSIFSPPGTTNVFFGQRDNPEIQLRYVREVVRDISVYGGLAYGVNFFTSSIQIISASISTTTFRRPSEFITNRHNISYGSVHLGARYTVRVKKNDAFNFSLGGKGIFYPAKDLSLTQNGFSEVRGEEFTFNFEMDPEDTASAFVGGLELDVNFQLGFQNSPLKIMIGITLDRVTSVVRELNSQIVLDSLTTDFRHNFGGARFGGFLGASYAL